MVLSADLGPELAMQVLVQFDKSMAEALGKKVKTSLSIKGHLHTYRFCGNVWTSILQDALFNVWASTLPSLASFNGGVTRWFGCSRFRAMSICMEQRRSRKVNFFRLKWEWDRNWVRIG